MEASHKCLESSIHSPDGSRERLFGLVEHGIHFGFQFSVLLCVLLVFEDCPQVFDKVCNDHICGVPGDDSQQEDAIIPQVALGELGGQLLVEIGVQFVVDFEILLGVVHLVFGEHDKVRPVYQVEASNTGNEDQPKPNEDEDFLVEQVDGQYALDREALQVLELTDADVTKRDAREPGTLSPGAVLCHVLHEFKSIKVVGRGQECVQQEQLPDGVRYVQDFDEKVHGRKVSPGSLVAEEAEESGGLVLGADKHVPFVLFVGVQPFVHESRDSIERLVSLFWGVVLGLLREVNAFVHVQAGPSVEDSPNHVG